MEHKDLIMEAITKDTLKMVNFMVQGLSIMQMENQPMRDSG